MLSRGDEMMNGAERRCSGSSDVELCTSGCVSLHTGANGRTNIGRLGGGPGEGVNIYSPLTPPSLPSVPAFPRKNLRT